MSHVDRKQIKLLWETDELVFSPSTSLVASAALLLSDKSPQGNFRITRLSEEVLIHTLKLDLKLSFLFVKDRIK